MRSNILFVSILVLAVPVFPVAADTIAFHIESVSYTPLPGDQDITTEVYLSNDTAPATALSLGYYIQLTITGNPGVTFNSSSITTVHTPLISWDYVTETNPGGPQNLQLAVMTDMGAGSEVSVEDDYGLATISLHIPGGTTGDFNLAFQNVNTFTTSGTNLHDDFWVMPGYIMLDSANGTPVSEVPEPSTLLLLVSGVPFLLQRKRLGSDILK